MKCLLEEGRIPHFLLFMRNNTSLAIPLSKKKAKIEPNETVVNNAPPIFAVLIQCKPRRPNRKSLPHENYRSVHIQCE